LDPLLSKRKRNWTIWTSNLQTLRTRPFKNQTWCINNPRYSQLLGQRRAMY